MGFGSHQVDVGIITILEGEFEAIHRRLPSKPEIIRRRQEYNLCRLPTRSGDHCSVALTRCLEQGNGQAQHVARDLLEDLDPQWLLVVGIAGGVPASELTLGDVVVSTRIYDFSVEAVTADHGREYAVGGGPLHPTAARIIANLPARRDDLGTWSSRTSIGVDRPKVELRDDAIGGDDKWRDRVRTSLHGHFHGDQTRDPVFVPAPIASSDRLVKDADVIRSWLRAARQIRAIEMEAAGVYRAAWARQIPALAIRGISDVVGFQRDDAWARYACQSAAAFTLAFLRLGAIPSRASLGRSPPPRPRYADATTQKLCDQLALARQRKQRLQAAGQATDEVDREILQLRRELREGGQLRAGDALADGRFLLLKKIGHGGFAFVWRAFDTARSQVVAIKVLHANLAGDSLRLERFFRGARIMAELDHSSVVRVLAREGHDQGFHFFVMEYVTGGNLHHAVLKKRITRAQILAVIYAVGDALACAHARGCVHRDVKPENILLAPGLRARLTDFDLVSAADTTGGTRTGMLGTYLYAAPEQLERPQDADARADVHGLAMTLVFALHGRTLPHRAGREPDRFIDTLDCSSGMKALLKRSIATEPAERTPGITSFCLALSGLPEVSEQITTELCTAEASHLLAPFLRLHDQVTAPPKVAVTVALLRHHHAGRLAEAAGDHVMAEMHYGQALGVRPHHLPTLIARADSLFKMADYDGARQIYQTILGEHRDALDKTDMVRMCHQLGKVGQALGERKKALNMFEQALELDPAHRDTLEAIIELQQQQGDWEAVINAKRHLMVNVSAREKPQLLAEIGGVYQDKLKNPQKAITAYLEAVAIAPKDYQLLKKILDLYTETRQWKKVVETIERFVALEPDAVRRGTYYHAAATVYRDELRSLDEAVDYYSKALDSFFENPERLSEAMIPRALQSFEALDKMLTTRRDWKAEERAYRDMIERLPKQGSPVFHKVLVGLLDGLGEIYRSRLKHYSSAAEAFEIAQQLDPKNETRPDGTDRTKLLAELYLVAGPEYADKAVAQHMRMLRSEPFRYDSYKALRRIYMSAHQSDKVWCVCRTLAFLGKADPDERQFYEQYKPRGLVKAKSVMSPDTWAKLVHPDENRYISAIFATCWQSVAAMKAFPHKDFGVKRKERHQLQGDPLTLFRLFYYVAQVLNVQVPEAYLVEDNKFADIQLVNAIEKDELCPSFIVRPHLLQGKSEREIAFLSACRLTFMWPEYYLKMLLLTSTELKAVILSAIAMVQPQFPVPPDMIKLVQRYLPEMRKRMPPQLLEQLGTVVARFVQTAPEIDLVRWGHAVEAISHRAGFVVCGDLEVAERMVSGEPFGVHGPQVEDRIKELVLYSISEDFFAVRKHLGLTIAG